MDQDDDIRSMESDLEAETKHTSNAQSIKTKTKPRSVKTSSERKSRSLKSGSLSHSISGSSSHSKSGSSHSHSKSRSSNSHSRKRDSRPTKNKSDSSKSKRRSTKSKSPPKSKKESVSEEVAEQMKMLGGTDYQRTLTAMGNLAERYEKMGVYKTAVEISVERLKLVRGSSDNSDTSASIRSLALKYSEHGNHEAVYGLADELKEQGSHKDALDTLELLLDHTSKHGEDRSDTARTMRCIDAVHVELRSKEVAMELYEKVLAEVIG